MKVAIAAVHESLVGTYRQSVGAVQGHVRSWGQSRPAG